MKIFNLYVITAAAGTGLLWLALLSGNPFFYALSFAAWFILAERIIKRTKRAALRKKQEKLFSDFSRSQSRFRRSY